MSVFAMMVIPAQIQVNPTGPALYGMGSIVLYDEFGNEVFAQSIHNRVVDEGEEDITTQMFQETTAGRADNLQFGAICVSNEATFTLAEGTTAASFDTADSLAATNCKEDTGVDVSGASTAVIGALTFTTSNLDAAGEAITGIGICQARSAADTDFANCAAGGTGTGGLLFSAVDITDVTLNAGETVAITYTFDISSSAT